MNEKLSLYLEILKLEPHSKLFFPAALMLREEGDINRALDVLKNGLNHHPEHLEARLAYADLLSGTDKSAEASAVFNRIIKAVISSPGFWQTWKLAAEQQADNNLAIALEMLSLAIGGKDVNWNEVIMNGLASLLNVEPRVSPEKSAEISLPKKADEPEALPLQEIAAPVRAAKEVVAPPVVEIPKPEPALAPAAEIPADIPAPESKPREAVPVSMVTIPPPPAEAKPVKAPEPMDRIENLIDELGDISELDENDDIFEEEADLETRTMAGLLEEQGDLEGALAIYEKLWRSSLPGKEREELAGLKNEVERKLSAAGGQGLPSEPPASEIKARSAVSQEERDEPGRKEKQDEEDSFLNTLEALAQRLEQRAAV